eukprot:TRINITY_DN3842_c0_g1_i1.p1 TRINITY_DN3842_c0_g1~~TRINITY_DN3842_c0_g1_i1.p1  ORF type:complete len:1303 (+),score=443.74 TRINITY_DN3842_c0_g1_i1:130-4038(+)
MQPGPVPPGPMPFGGGGPPPPGMAGGAAQRQGRSLTPRRFSVGVPMQQQQQQQPQQLAEPIVMAAAPRPAAADPALCVDMRATSPSRVFFLPPPPGGEQPQSAPPPGVAAPPRQRWLQHPAAFRGSASVQVPVAGSAVPAPLLPAEFCNGSAAAAGGPISSQVVAVNALRIPQPATAAGPPVGAMPPGVVRVVANQRLFPAALQPPTSAGSVSIPQPTALRRSGSAPASAFRVRSVSRPAQRPAVLPTYPTVPAEPICVQQLPPPPLSVAQPQVIQVVSPPPRMLFQAAGLVSPDVTNGMNGMAAELEKEMAEGDVISLISMPALTGTKEVAYGADAFARREVDAQADDMDLSSRARATRQAQIAELRRLLGAPTGTKDVDNSSTNLGGSDEAGTPLRARIAEVEAERDAFRTKVQHLEEEMNAASAERLELLNAHRKLEAIAEEIANLKGEREAELTGARETALAEVRQLIIERDEALGKLGELQVSSADDVATHRNRCSELQDSVDFLTTQRDTAARNYGAAADRIRELEEAMHASLAAKEETAAVIQELRREVEAHRGRHGELEALTDSLTSEKHHLSRTSLQTEESLRRLQQDLHSKHSDLQNLAGALEDKSREHTSMEALLAELQAELEQCKAEKEQLAKDLLDSMEAVKGLEEQKTASQRQVAELEEQLETFLEDKDALMKTNGNQVARIAELEDLCDALNKEKTVFKSGSEYAGELERRCEALKGERSKLKERVQELDELCDKLQREGRRSSERLKEAEAECESVKAKREQCLQQIQELEEQCDLFLEDKENLMKANNAQLERIGEFEEAAAKAKADKEQLKKGLEAAEARVKELERELKKVQYECKEATERMLALEESLDESSRRQESHEESIMSHRRSVTDLEVRLQEAHSHHERRASSLQGSVTDLQKKLKEAKASEEQLGSEVRELRLSLQSKSKSLEKAMAEAQTERTQQLAQLETDYEEQLKHIKQQNEELRKELSEAQNALTESRGELNRAIVARQKVESDAASAFNKSDDFRRKTDSEWNERLRQSVEMEKQLRAQIFELEAQVATNGRQEQQKPQQTPTSLKSPGWQALRSVPKATLAPKAAGRYAEIDRTGTLKPGGRSGNMSGLPDAYVKVMQQIDQLGWEKMHWNRNVTLLHWAAKNDLADLCGRFLAQGADAHHRDDNGKSALEYARERGSTRAAAVLMQPAPAEVGPLEDIVRSYAGQVSFHANAGDSRRSSKNSKESLLVAGFASTVSQPRSSTTQLEVDVRDGLRAASERRSSSSGRGGGARGGGGALSARLQSAGFAS